MRHGILDFGFGGWLMTGTDFLLSVMLILAAAALIHGLFFAVRTGGGRS